MAEDGFLAAVGGALVAIATLGMVREDDAAPGGGDVGTPVMRHRVESLDGRDTVEDGVS